MGTKHSGRIFKKKGIIRNCSSHRDEKLHVNGMNVEERVLGNRLHRLMNANEMQFGSMHERGTIYAVFIVTRC